jgi:hypothetical protein
MGGACGTHGGEEQCYRVVVGETWRWETTSKTVGSSLVTNCLTPYAWKNKALSYF